MTLLLPGVKSVKQSSKPTMHKPLRDVEASGKLRDLVAELAALKIVTR